MRRGLLIVACALACVGGAAAAGTPADGLVLRIDVSTGPRGGTLFVNGCSSLDVVGRGQGPQSGATISKSVGGWRDATVETGAGGGLDLGYESGALVFAHPSWWVTSPDGALYQLQMLLEPGPGCTPPQSSTSAAGDVYSATWQATACSKASGDLVCGQPSYGGGGCFAVWRAGHRAVLTFQLAGCSPSSWPAIPATAPPSQSSVTADASARGVALEQDGIDVSRLDRNTRYRFVFHGSGAFNVHLRGPGVDVASKPGKFGVWILTLRPGTYRYWSDNAPRRVKGSFRVP